MHSKEIKTSQNHCVGNSAGLTEPDRFALLQTGENTELRPERLESRLVVGSNPSLGFFCMFSLGTPASSEAQISPSVRLIFN